MNTEEFIDTLNSTLGIDLWPSVSATLLMGEGLYENEDYYRGTMILVEPMNISGLKEIIKDFIKDKKIISNRLEDIEGPVWYIVWNGKEKSCKIGYWDGLERGSQGDVGFSFDIHIGSRRGLGGGNIWLNLNHRWSWLKSKGEVYIFEPTLIKNQFLNWLNENPLEVKQ